MQNVKIIKTLILNILYVESESTTHLKSGKTYRRKRSRKTYKIKCDNCKELFERTSENFSPKRANITMNTFVVIAEMFLVWLQYLIIKKIQIKMIISSVQKLLIAMDMFKFM